MEKITIIIPVFNEQGGLVKLYRELSLITKNKSEIKDRDNRFYVDLSQFDWEFLFINDGSTDRSLNKLLELRESDRRINVVNFSRNFGKETALLAGLDFSGGDAVIIMDADLQHPVSVIPEMIYWWRKGYDDVYGQRVNRGKEPFVRKTLSKIYYSILQKFTNVDILSNVGDFRLLSRRAVNALVSMRESQRYTKGLYCWIGFNKKAVNFEVSKRMEGRSSYNYGKLFNLAIDGITSYSTSPLRIASVMGILVSFLSMLYLILVICKYIFYGEAVQGYPTLVCLILFLGGIQLLALGIIGEYVARIFNESKRRPAYIIESVNGRPDDLSRNSM